MRRALIPLTLIVTSCAFAAGESHWSCMAEFVLMRRAEIQDHKLVMDSNKVPCDPCDHQDVLTAARLVHELDYEPGIRVGLGYDRERTWSLDFNYLWIPEWEGSHSVHDTGALSFPGGFSSDFTSADRAKGEYESHFQNGEANWWSHVTPRDINYFSVSWLAGLRYDNLNEHFKLIFHKGTNRSSYNIHTQNYLLGPQLGLNIQWNPIEHLGWDFTVKMGEMLNYARNKVFMGDEDNTVALRHFRRQECNAAFMTDVALQLGYEWFSHLNTHVGYEMIYLSGLAIAGDQIDKRPKSTSRLLTNGDAIIHGLFLGLKYTF
jgi:hypothetical protein